MRTKLYLASLLWLGVLPAACGSSSSLSGQLPGRWQSVGCEPAGMVYVKRDFTLGTGPWQLTATIYTDSGCASPFVAVGAGGSYQVEVASAQVVGATEVNYNFTSRQVTPLSQAGVSTLTTAKCGTGTWVQGQAGDISGTGCTALGLPSDLSCPTEMDLNEIDGGMLYFGDRSGDLCTARPTKLGPALQRTQ